MARRQVTVGGSTSLVALCICTRNRPSELDRVLRSVEAAHLKPKQVVVSDDSDAEIVPKNADVCAEHANVEYTRGPQRGLSANRNHALAQLSPDVEWVAFVDDDVIVSADYFSLADDLLSHTGNGTIVTGAERRDGALVTPQNPSFFGYQEVVPTDRSGLRAIVINATIFPRRLFNEVTFDENLRYGCEELDVCSQALRHGYVIRFVSNLVNDHRASPINRLDYSLLIDTSRLYATFKRYWWLEHKRIKGVAYAILGPLHLIASRGRRNGLAGIHSSLRSVAAAIGLVRHTLG